MLIRETKAEALRRYEEAARSLDDFNDVIATWDKLDQTRERRERYNEVLREEGTLEYGRDVDGLIFPQWMMDATYRQLSRGSFLDYLFDCPYEMHDLTSKAYLRKIVEGMKEDHKEIFFFLYLRQYSPQRLAAIQGQTDRNIRKVRDVLLRKIKKGVGSVWNASTDNDRYLFPLLMTFRASPEAMAMSFMRDYGERYDWLVTVMKEWAFILITEYYYYDEEYPSDEETRDLYRKGMAAFDGNAPTYHMELRDRPTIVWDFHSLMLNIKLMFSFMLTDENTPLRLCRECAKPFIAPRSISYFCSPACREKHKNKRK